ncbi:hypothetical protein DFS34DRAFT_635057 [Phlyctochytrium arcticum]|nr:hypothetical protein DFS34DRAFT_635057 [Phlyctochytrium arcticum]
MSQTLNSADLLQELLRYKESQLHQLEVKNRELTSKCSDLKEQNRNVQRHSTENLRQHKTFLKAARDEYLLKVGNVSIDEDRARLGQVRALRELAKLHEKSKITGIPVRGTVVMPTGSGKALTALLTQFYMKPTSLPVVVLCAHIYPTQQLYDLLLSLDTSQSKSLYMSKFLRDTGGKRPQSSFFSLRDFYSQTFVDIVSSDHTRAKRKRWWLKEQAPIHLFAAFQTFQSMYKFESQRVRNFCDKVDADSHLSQADKDRKKRWYMDTLIQPSLILVDEVQLSVQMVEDLKADFPKANIICFTATPPLHRSRTLGTDTCSNILFEMTDRDFIQHGQKTRNQTSKNAVWVEYVMPLTTGALHIDGKKATAKVIERQSWLSKTFRRSLDELEQIQKLYTRGIVTLLFHLRNTTHPGCYMVHRCRDIHTARNYERYFSAYVGDPSAVMLVTSKSGANRSTGDVVKKIRDKQTNVLVVIIVQMLSVSFHDPRICLVSIAHADLRYDSFVQTCGRGASRQLNDPDAPAWYLIVTPQISHHDISWRYWKLKAHFGVRRAYDVTSAGSKNDLTESERRTMRSFADAPTMSHSENSVGPVRLMRADMMSGSFILRDSLVSGSAVKPTSSEWKAIGQLKVPYPTGETSLCNTKEGFGWSPSDRFDFGLSGLQEPTVLSSEDEDWLAAGSDDDQKSQGSDFSERFAEELGVDMDHDYFSTKNSSLFSNMSTPQEAEFPSHFPNDMTVASPSTSSTGQAMEVSSDEDDFKSSERSWPATCNLCETAFRSTKELFSHYNTFSHEDRVEELNATFMKMDPDDDVSSARHTPARSCAKRIRYAPPSPTPKRLAPTPKNVESLLFDESRPTFCTLCVYESDSPELAIEHYLTDSLHRRLGGQLRYCPPCDRTFVTNVGAQQHMDSQIHQNCVAQRIRGSRAEISHPQ